MAYRVILSEIQELELKDIVKNNKANPNLLKRAYCILLKNEGQQNENIVRLLGIHEDSIADWTKIFLRRLLMRTFRRSSPISEAECSLICPAAWMS